ncbi:MAG: carbohydrate ABC transporter permease [Clostridiales bacterium]
MRYRIFAKIFFYILLISISIIVIFPFYWMVSASLKKSNEVFSYPIKWIPDVIRWENYLDIWNQIPLMTFYKNTLFLAISVTFLSLLTSSLAAYAFSKIKFPGRNIIFICYISTIAVPFQVYMIPQFIMMKKLELNDTLLALILIQTFSAFGVFLFRQFFITIPNEISESARIDGLGEFGIYLRIVLPLSKPAIATLIIFQFVFVWNDFLGPLIYLSSTENKTIQLGIRMFISQYTAEYSLIMAAAVCSIVPVIILFMFTQKLFIEGIATSGIKG